MATWGLHIRIAERLLEKFDYLDHESFLVGNIGPDCGKPNETWTSFTPSREVSHWIDDNRDFRADLFYEAYLNNPTKNHKEYSFLIGYYVHLLTDKEWGHYIDDKKETHESYKKLNEDKSFIWTIKEDWYDLDRMYFRDNPDCIFYTTFQHIKSFPNYLDYYPEDAVMDRVTYITDYYMKPKDNLDRDYPYLTKSEMDNFLDNATTIIMNKLETISS